jgi:hypothetical protein
MLAQIPIGKRSHEAGGDGKKDNHAKECLSEQT